MNKTVMNINNTKIIKQKYNNNEIETLKSNKYL